jgi:hypothetical protein
MLLHPTKGANPHFASCIMCGEKTGAIVLVGARERKYKCKTCEAVSFDAEKCGYCGSDAEYIGIVQDNELIPAGFCSPCEERRKLEESIVKDGGVYYRCLACKFGGVIPPSKFATELRGMAGVLTPQLLAVELDSTNCPRCRRESKHYIRHPLVA